MCVCVHAIVCVCGVLMCECVCTCECWLMQVVFTNFGSFDCYLSLIKLIKLVQYIIRVHSYTFFESLNKRKYIQNFSIGIKYTNIRTEQLRYVFGLTTYYDDTCVICS